MTLDEFLKEQEKVLREEQIAKEKMRKAFIDAKCKELGCKRLAKCADCDKYVPSDQNLPFFEKGKDYDVYYCGCYGWD